LRLKSVKNQLGAVCRYEYDAAGRMIQEIDFGGRV
jgi:YD repeat-containing protein